MTMTLPTVRPLDYCGMLIQTRDEMLSLTDMWRAAGSDDARRPANWTRKDGADFIEHMKAVLNVPHGHIISAQRGRGVGETWAHWQIALAYAKYLSPEFHMWCNTVVREYMEGSLSHPAFDSTRFVRQIEAIVEARLAHALTHATVTLLPKMVTAALAEQNIMLRRGKTAGQLWHEYNLPKIKGIATWFGNRLAQMQCRIEGNGCAEMGVSTARLFDPDKVRAWMEDGGGRFVIELKVKERQGQGRLRLVQPGE
jgi:hypothetical protein